MKYKGIRYHVGCGGEVYHGVCIKCGKKSKKGLLKKILGEGPLLVEEEDIEKIRRSSHRRRIREGRDIFKEEQ